MKVDQANFYKPPFAPPVQEPMRLRVPRGLFGIDRNDDLSGSDPPLSCSSPPFTHYRRFHEGIDLLGEAGCPVFAARRGWVVKVKNPSSAENKAIVMTHHYHSKGYVTRYLHLRDVFVNEGDYIEAGRLIGTIGNISNNPNLNHLHFELHKVINNTNSDILWYRQNTEVLDPTRIMYDWELILVDSEPSTGSADIIDEAGIVRYSKVPMFQIKHGNEFHVIPLYHPSPDEIALIESLNLAFLHEQEVRIATMNSYFFGDRSRIISARVLK